jgi:cell division protein ZapA
MAKVSITVNGRRYDIGCDDGQEAHVFRLADDLDRRVGQLAAGVGQVGEARLLVLVALMLADELADAQRDLEALRSAAGEGSGLVGVGVDGAVGAGLCRLAERIEALAARLDPPPAIAEAGD